MGWVALGLFVASVVSAVTGLVWTLVRSGEKTPRTGPDVGEEMVASMMRDGLEDNIVVQKTAFKGDAAAVHGEAEFSFSEIKAAVLEGRWGFALPIVLALGGAFGVLVFGALSVFFLLNKVVGGLFLAAALYAVVRTALAFRKA
ncbi:MAG: hypothetical protein JXR94_03475 [Candidatus Hydrogenedentes bacterium]|nr:hypothetical protein [Candidatus Hydrogenedentota bacterium]